MLFQFPDPYPGECLYSILCRFHLRSANRTDNASLVQLFGKRRSIRSTLHSPKVLQYADMWIRESDVLNYSLLSYNHTMINYAKPMGLYTTWEYTDGNGVKKASHYFSRSLIHQAKKLRYCPSCMRQQKSLYGEPYWQVLPQIEGCEICPIHGEVYRNSTVSVSDISYNFYPASAVLQEKGSEGNIPDNLAEIEDHYDVYQVVSKEALWLLVNGASCEARNSNRTLYYFRVAMEELDFKELNYLTAKSGLGDIRFFENPKSLALYMGYILSPPQYIYLISLIFGSMDAYNRGVSQGTAL